MSQLKCPLGEDCDMTLAWMMGAERAKDTIIVLRKDCERHKAEIASLLNVIADTRTENMRLRAENSSLAAWQCEFTDGKTGLVAGEGGSTYCAMAKRVERLRAALELYRDAVRIDATMEGPKFMGANSSALKRAWDADRAALNGEGWEGL